MAKRKLGSVKRTDEILLAPVDLATDVTGHLKSGTGMPPGMDGAPGRDSFVPGPRGKTGSRGLQGIPGLDGREPREPLMIAGPRGAIGANGANGAAGAAGAKGSSGPPGLDGRSSREHPFVAPILPSPEGAFGVNGSHWGIGGDLAVTNTYHQLGRVSAGVSGVVTLPIDTLRAVPFTIARTAKIDWLATRITIVATAGGVARMGIYASNPRSGNGPGALLVDSGQFVTTAVTSPVVPATPNPTLYAGRIYWYAFLAGVAQAEFAGLEPADAWYGVLGLGSGSFAGSPDNYLTIAQAYGALPAVFPASGSSRGVVPALFVRYA